MKVTHLVQNGKDILILEAITPVEKEQLKEFGRPWNKYSAELHEDAYHKYPCLIIRKE